MSQLHQGFITSFNRNKTIKFSLLRMAHPNIRINTVTEQSADRLNGNNPEIHIETVKLVVRTKLMRPCSHVEERFQPINSEQNHIY